MTDEICRFCRWWSAPEPVEVTPGIEHRAIFPSAWFECRRRAPTAPRDQPSQRMWPITHSNDFCGDFRRVK